MGSALRKVLCIGLSRSGIALLQLTGWPRFRIDLLSDVPLPHEESNSPEHLAIRLSSMFAENKCSGLPLTVILADDMVRLFMVTPPHNATRVQDCRTAAEMRFQALYGEPLSHWQLEADWSGHQPFLACAVPKLILEGTQQATREHRITLVKIQPKFVAAWNAWHAALNDSAWFGVASERTMTIGAIDKQRLCMVRTSPIPTEAINDIQWLPEHLTREALRFDLPVPQQIKLCGYSTGRSTTTVGSLTCSHLDAAQPPLAGIGVSARIALAQSGLRQ